MRHILGTVLLASLAACQAVPEPPEAWEAVGPGAVLHLERVLIVPPETAHVTLQGGQVVSDVERDFYYAHCELHVRDPAPHPQTIEPDRFRVTAVETEVESVMARPRRYAARGMLYAEGPTADAYKVIFHLHSTRQPQVTHLECHHWEDPTLFPRHLRLEEINTALGGFARLLPESVPAR